MIRCNEGGPGISSQCTTRCIVKNGSRVLFEATLGIVTMPARDGTKLKVSDEARVDEVDEETTGRTRTIRYKLSATMRCTVQSCTSQHAK